MIKGKLSKLCGDFTGYLTVYAALILVFLLSLFLTVLEGVRVNTIQLESEVIADIGLDSVLAEYHRELWNQYGMLWIDTSYGNQSPDIENAEAHLLGYLEKNCDMEDVLLGQYIYRDFLGLETETVEINEVALATDEDGRYFRSQAVEIVKSETGISLAEDVLEWLTIILENNLDRGRYLEQQIEISYNEMMDYDGISKQVGKDWITVQVDNPVKILDSFKNKGILHLVLKEDEQVSAAAIDNTTLVSRRSWRGELNKGNWSVETGAEGIIERLLWQEYLMRYCGRYGHVLNKGALDYQLEYLIVGNNTDIDNLKGVVYRISGIREAANALYLFSDEVKCAEAQTLAMILSTAMMIPEAEPVIRTIILLVWAYAESLYDVECLLAGRKVPLIKTEESWHYSLDGIVEGLFSSDEEGVQTQEEGVFALGYEDYLRVLLMLTSLNDQTLRMMDIVEMDIRQTPGNSHFRLDGCVDRLSAEITIQSTYGYRITMRKRKGY